jgi:hypothetical protein
MRLPHALRSLLGPVLFWVGLLGFVMREVSGGKRRHLND